MTDSQTQDKKNEEIEVKEEEQSYEGETSAHIHDGIVQPKIKHSDLEDLDVGTAHDHGELDGLSDDDHTNYHNNTRGDVRYLYKENTDAFTPDGDYEPATKKYVDDNIPSEVDWMFGDGSDGDVEINSGSFSSGPITSNALTRDAYFDTLELSGGDLDTAGYKLFCKTALITNSGYKVNRNGNAGGNGGNGDNGKLSGTSNGGSSGSAGAALADGSIKGALAGKDGGAGGNGGISSGDGDNGVGGGAGVNTTISLGVDGSNNSGKAGGDGGYSQVLPGGGSCTQDHSGGSGNIGGGKGTHSDPVNVLKLLPHILDTTDLQSDGTLSKHQSSASSGAGGGGGGGAGADYSSADASGGAGGGGGGSGSPGGIVLICAKTITNSGGIEAKGGDGGNGGAGGDGLMDQTFSPSEYAISGGGGGGSGGAGGSGGVVILVYRTKTGNAPDVSGGTAGTGGSKGDRACADDCCSETGTDGEAGENGTTGVTYNFAV